MPSMLQKRSSLWISTSTTSLITLYFPPMTLRKQLKSPKIEQSVPLKSLILMQNSQWSPITWTNNRWERYSQIFKIRELLDKVQSCQTSSPELQVHWEMPVNTVLSDLRTIHRLQELTTLQNTESTQASKTEVLSLILHLGIMEPLPQWIIILQKQH
jgi:hypothetical protein